MSEQESIEQQPNLAADDHRRLGAELGLFASDPLLPVGMPIWLPAGAAIRNELEQYILHQERLSGYQHVYSPPLGKVEMYKVSGHWDQYKDSMFEPIQDGHEQIVLRPMNCPHHVVAYRSQPRSWRSLPLRIAEIGAMFRQEPSGSLSGLSRVRAMALNDAHHFVSQEHIAGEVAMVLEMIEQAYKDLGLSGHSYRLSLSGAGSKFVGSKERWDGAEAALRDVLKSLNLDYEEAPGEAAFYGPKIDVQMPGRGGRVESFSSVQLDFHLPSQFGLSYAGPSGDERPAMIHRSVLSSMERCLSFLLEQHAGNLPAWYSPVHMVIMPVKDADEAQVEYAHQLAREALSRGLRAEVLSAGSLPSRIMLARGKKVPWRVVVGAREVSAGEVSVNLRSEEKLPSMPWGKFFEGAQGVVDSRSQNLWGSVSPPRRLSQEELKEGRIVAP